MSSSLKALLRHPSIWRASDDRQRIFPVVATGNAILDRHLPGGGWPAQGLIELLTDQPGLCELSLLLPALAGFHRQHPGWLFLGTPPHEPYAPALAARGLDVGRVLVVRSEEILWAMEQALHSAVCRVVLGWVSDREPLHRQALRRLQLAAMETQSLCVLMRPLRAGQRPSPAVLRMMLLPGRQQLALRILKSRGGRTCELTLEYDAALWGRPSFQAGP